MRERAMLLGKRPRPPMLRTTSMTEFALDLAAPEAGEPSPPVPHQQQRNRQRAPTHAIQDEDMMAVSRYVAAVATPRSGARRYSGGFEAIETASFLRACGLCQRRLGPGRDTFMYRGEVAFCSLECRQQQMSLDERKEKEKCSLASMMEDGPPATTAVSETSNGGGETVAAA